MGRVRVKDYEGKVETPYGLALYMVDKLFRGKPPSSTSRVLDAGCGRGVFIRAVIDWCRMRGVELPEIVGVEIDYELVREAQTRFRGYRNVRIVQGDFLLLSKADLGVFDYVIGNPPYISYEKMDEHKRKLYKKMFRTAIGRFDLYMLFFEKALELLKSGGRLVFITPEKYLYVLSARELRKVLVQYHVEEIELVSENAFGNILAYPAITVLNKTEHGRTKLVLRNGRTLLVELPMDGSSWLYAIGPSTRQHRYRLRDIALRISAGIATGRDKVFIVPRSLLPEELKPYAFPTISGSELSKFKPGETINPNQLSNMIIVPYDRKGKLLDEDKAKPILQYLSKWRKELEERHVVRLKKKKWYAFHEDPPMQLILRPKILWSDLAREPAFYADTQGIIIPRHSVYYLVPKNPKIIPKLLQYLNNDIVKEWVKCCCQKAANGYIRLQSHILKELPIPDELYEEATNPSKPDKTQEINT